MNIEQLRHEISGRHACCHLSVGESVCSDGVLFPSAHCLSTCSDFLRPSRLTKHRAADESTYRFTPHLEISPSTRPSHALAVLLSCHHFSSWASTWKTCWLGHQHCLGSSPDLPCAPRLHKGQLGVAPSSQKTRGEGVRETGPSPPRVVGCTTCLGDVLNNDSFRRRSHSSVPLTFRNR